MANRISDYKIKVIAAEYLINGNNEVKALISAGYSKNYAQQAYHRIFSNDKLQHAIGKEIVKISVKNDITVEKVLCDLEDLRKMCLKNKDYSTAKGCSELQGKHLAMFTNVTSVNTAETRRKMDEDEREEVKKLAALRFSQPNIVQIFNESLTVSSTDTGAEAAM